MTEQTTEPEAPDELQGIDEVFHECVRTHGREMFALVYNSAMSQQALGEVARMADKHRSQGLFHALNVLTNSFNALSNDYCAKQGWTPEQLAACQQAIQLAFKSKIVVPGSSILLQ